MRSVALRGDRSPSSVLGHERASGGVAPRDPRRVSPPAEPPRRGLFRRRRNRRITVARPSVLVWVAAGLQALGRRLLFLGKAVAVLAFVAGAAWGGQRVVSHVIASPRFALREVRVAATAHVREDEVLALAAANPGDRLLAIDTDAVAARVATHPWVASARVRRVLPSALAIDVTERRAVATALLGALYLVDAAGHPFKRATMDEADGLAVITGVSREQYGNYRAATEGAFREALELLAAYQAPDGLPGSHPRPALSEVHVDPRYGFSLVLYDGGGELRLGRGAWADKLARFDEIVAALGPRGPAVLRLVHLDGGSRERVTVRLSD
jgi:cell division protein FtsQ